MRWTFRRGGCHAVYDLAQDPGQPNSDQNAAADDVRRKAATFVGADFDEIALVRNTTEGMNFMLSRPRPESRR